MNDNSKFFFNAQGNEDIKHIIHLNQHPFVVLGKSGVLYSIVEKSKENVHTCPDCAAEQGYVVDPDEPIHDDPSYDPEYVIPEELFEELNDNDFDFDDAYKDYTDFTYHSLVINAIFSEDCVLSREHLNIAHSDSIGVEFNKVSLDGGEFINVDSNISLNITAGKHTFTFIITEYVPENHDGTITIDDGFNSYFVRNSALQEYDLRIGDSIKDISGGSYQLTGYKLQHIIVDKDNEYLDSRENCNAVIDTETNQLQYASQNTFIPDTVSSIGYRAYEGITLEDLFIPASVTDIDYTAFSDNCKILNNIVVDENNAVYDSRENCNAIIKTETDTLLKGCNNTIIPNSVKNIDYTAFRNCEELTSINIPGSVKILSNSLFSGCTNLANVILNEGIQTIYNRVFSDCIFEDIVLPSTITHLGLDCISSSTIKNITILATTPPNVEYFTYTSNGYGPSRYEYVYRFTTSVNGSFKAIPDIKIFVPQQSVEAYKNSKYFELYKDVIFPIEQ